MARERGKLNSVGIKFSDLEGFNKTLDILIGVDIYAKTFDREL